MRNLKGFVFLLMAATWLQGNVSAQETSSYPKEVQQKIEQVERGLLGWVQTQDDTRWTVQERMKKYHVNGLSIAVVHNYKIEWAKGYGWADSAQQRPVTTQTLFQAASISKSLNGVGIMTLVQDKKIDLYTDINQYLSNWKFPYDTVSHNKKITVANLLSHTGGLTVHGFGGYEVGDSLPSIEEILDGKRPANSPPVRSAEEPSIRSEYSGGGITISQLILTDVTHQPYDKYMAEHVLQPLGMSGSFYTQPPPVAKQLLLATGYRAGGQEIKGKYHIYPEQAAAGLWTNPTDLAKYIIETQLAYNGKSSKVLTQATTQLRLTPYIDKSAALGVFITKHGDTVLFSHGGANEGFRCQYYGSTATGDGVVVMVNSDNGAINEEIINGVATVYNWQGFYHPVKKTVTTIPAATMQSYTGKYLLGGDTIKVSMEGDHLMIDGGDVIMQAYFTSGKDFFVYETRLPLSFVTDDDGKATGIKVGGTDMAKKIE